MKRTIKFRALFKNTSQKTFWQHSKPNHVVENTHNLIQMTDWLEHTGHKDKNGKEIYEGDIVSSQYGNLQAKWCSFDYCWCWQNEFESYWFNEMESENLVIIGNIYENPELLEEIKANQ